MPRLHIVNKSPFASGALSTCLRLAKSRDSILLIEDSVYAAVSGADCSACVNEALGRFNFYALGLDMEARGIARESVIPRLKIVDYGGFVDLAVAHDGAQSWY